MPNMTLGSPEWLAREARTGAPPPEHALTAYALPCGAVVRYRRGRPVDILAGRDVLAFELWTDLFDAAARISTLPDYRVPIAEARAFVEKMQPAMVAAPPSETPFTK